MSETLKFKSNAGWRTAPWRLNSYVCSNKECGHWLTTVDVDEGVTPFSMMCEKCVSHSLSAMYPTNRPVPDHAPEPTREWYRKRK